MSKTEKPQIDKFKPQRVNANKHNPRGMKALDDSILQDGWIGAITTAADGETFDGSARLETLQQGESADPIVVEIDGTRPVILKRLDIANADDPKAQRLAIAANRVAELNLDWDADILAELSQEIDLTGLWSDEELSNLLASQESGEGSGEEDEEEVSDLIDEAESGGLESRVLLGQIWKLGRHYIACGDSTSESNVKKLLGDRFKDVGMVWADPPYGMNLNTDFSSAKSRPDFAEEKSAFGGHAYAPVIGDNEDFDPRPLIEMFSKVKEQYWWGADYYAERLPNKNTGSWLIWDKRVEESMDAVYGSVFETCWSKARHKRAMIRIKWAGIFGMEKEDTKKRVHPTQKPYSVPQWCFEKYGKPNDLIFDPFLGSAPSIIAAQQMEGDRAVFGFELSEAYCEVICRRFESLTGINAELVGSLTNG